jgi:DNA-binding beta-propeller fold protein YncE
MLEIGITANKENLMRKVLLATSLMLLGSSAILAQEHTIIALGHADFSVNEIDPATGKTIQRFKAVNQPHEAAISPDGKTIYASVPQAGHVVILGPTLEEKGKIETPFFHAHTPAPGARGNAQSAGVSVPDSSLPHGMGLNTDGSKLYIGVENADVPGVVVYDTGSNKVLRKIDLLLKGGHYLQVQPGTDKVYYPHRTDNRVVVIDGKTDTISRIIDVPGGPVGVDFAPNGEVWIHCDGNNGIEGTVNVIDSKTDKVIKMIQTPGKGAGRMAVSRDGKWAASTHGDSKDVAIIDAEKKELMGSVEVGGLGFPLFSPDSTKLYVMVTTTSDIAVLDLKSMKVVDRWKAGEETFGGGIRYTNGRPNP